ncbi:FtsB family cell division protein [Geomonas agri]|uniref:FtsB family cell division protein n=1 Tax=Geomonas agri TaxID=2873702 RepID=UPI001CD6CE02|nr:septum formation initiator family protein [Geomonas agri]
MQKRFFLVPAAVIVFILCFTVFGDRGLLRINHLHRDLDETQKHLNELKEENDKLKREIAALQSDRRYLESIARRDFGLVRSNEVIYQFPGSGKSVAPTAQPEAAPAAHAPQGATAGKLAQPVQPAARSGK